MTKKTTASTEAQIQERLIQMVSRMEVKAGVNWLRTATMGGVKLSIGQAAKVKRSGYVKGVPDMLFFEPSPCGKYIGLAIELKTLKGRPSIEQKNWVKGLEERGWKAVISKGFDATAEVIADYFGVTVPPFS